MGLKTGPRTAWLQLVIGGISVVSISMSYLLRSHYFNTVG